MSPGLPKLSLGAYKNDTKTTQVVQKWVPSANPNFLMNFYPNWGPLFGPFDIRSGQWWSQKSEKGGFWKVPKK